MVDAAVSKTVEGQLSCRFESDLRHQWIFHPLTPAAKALDKKSRRPGRDGGIIISIYCGLTDYEVKWVPRYTARVIKSTPSSSNPVNKARSFPSLFTSSIILFFIIFPLLLFIFLSYANKTQVRDGRFRQH